MKRLHIHVSVEDLAGSIRFYQTMFAVAPTVRQVDYAKWLLDDPRVNFAISQRGAAPGLNHLGVQVESAAELADMRNRLQGLQSAIIEQEGAACCYAKSDKYWVADPQGIAWETFHTVDGIPVFGRDDAGAAEKSACCIPLANSTVDGERPCCVPRRDSKTTGACC